MRYAELIEKLQDLPAEKTVNQAVKCPLTPLLPRGGAEKAVLDFALFFLLTLITLAFPILTHAATAVGATPGSFKVSETGAATYSIPLTAPPGTAGMAPTLSLNYNSQGGNGPLGVGWSLGGLSAVTRCPATIVQDGFKGGINYDGNDRYCLDGQRLVAVSGAYGANGTEYRTETESYTRVVSYGTAGNGPAWFKAWTKAGQMIEYGNTADSRIEAQGKPTVRVWGVNKISDTKTNYIAVAYSEDNANGEFYVSRINYTGNAAAGVAPYASVQFGYEGRPDIESGYEVGSIIKSTKRIISIKMYVGTYYWIKNYQLNYEIGASSNRSRTTVLTECDFNNICLSTTFDWHSPILGYTTNSTWPGHGVSNTGGNWVDLNGDGKADYVTSSNTGVHYVSLSTGTGYINQIWSGHGVSNTGGHWVDLNGDGKADYVTSSNTGVHYVSLSTGTGYINQIWSGHGVSNTGANWVDLNGDGKADYVTSSNTGIHYVSLSSGTGYINQIWSGHGVSNTGGHWVDLNGDGKADYVTSSNTGVHYVSLSTGTGYINQGWSGHGVSNTGGHWVDLNGDGKADYVTSSNTGVHYVSLSTGTGYINQGWSGHGVSNTGGHWVDLNGDGKADYVTSSNTGVHYVSLNSLGQPDILTTSISGLGVTTIITYKAITDSNVYSKDTTSTYPYLDFQAPLYVVSQTQTSNGIGGTYTANYTYAGAKIHELGGGFLGFRQVAANDPQTGITTTTTYSQNYPYQGLPQTVEKRTSTGQLLNQAQNTWQNIALGSGSYHRSDLVQTLEQSWDLNGAAMPRSQTNTTYDTYGNATQIRAATDDGYTTAGPVSPFGNVKTTTNTYTNDTTNWLLGRLTRATVTSALPTGATATRTSGFAYEAGSGLLKQEIIEPDIASLKLTTSYTLDKFGNRVAVTVSGADIATRTSSTTYDAQGRFALSSTNALGHKETRTFEPGFGNPVSLTGPNGLTTYWAYDGFGRKLQENRADGTQSSFSYNFCASNCPAYGVYYAIGISSGAPASTVYYDSLNRELRKSSVGFDGRVASVDKVYNNLGQVTYTSRPYFPGEAVSWTQFQYDLLGRPVRVTEADGGVTQSSYNGLGLSVTNPLGRTTTQTKNGLGLVVKTVDALNNAMKFSFDPFGNPLKTIDPKGNAVSLSYDLRGRKIAMTDPDMGAWSYGYDVLGEMLWQKNAKGQITYVYYDPLGRIVKRQEADLTSVWTWDTASKGIGKLAAESTSNGFSRSYAYDNYGRLAQTTTSINGAGSYVQATQYDSLGRVSRFIHPTGLSTVNVYNAYGYLAEVRDGTTQNPYWQAQTVDASGRILLERLGNNLYTQRSFDGMGRPTYIATGKFGVTPDIQNLHLNHDQNGNLISRDDYATQRGDSFVYDELDRLTVDLGPNGKILNYQYDLLGNISFKTDVGSYFYGAKPHAVTRITGNVNATLQYDANGNQTVGLNNRTVAYTSYDMPSKIVQGTNTVTFDYDANHARFRQTGPNGMTVYLNPRMDLGGHFEQTVGGSGTESRHTVYAAGKAIAEVVSNGGYKQTRYFHTDHLGSIDAVTDDNAVVLARYAFDPFGARTPLYGNFGATRHGFTGHEELPEVGLIHMNGRVYDPTLGRFLSADPQIQAPFNLQSYNRYSYVLNNPLVYVDPTGYSWLSKTWKKVWHNPIVRAVATIAVAYFTAGLASAAYQSYAATTILNGGTALTIGSSVSMTSGIIGGAAGGFSAGLVASNGNFQSAIKSGLSGTMTGGISGYYGPEYSIGRVLANGLGSGISSTIQGGNFIDGIKSGIVTSTLAYANVLMRQEMIASSLKNPLNDGTGLSGGMYGDNFKLGGIRLSDVLIKLGITSGPLGGAQSGPGTLFGMPYDKGGFIDMVIESFSGPHDFANAPHFYAPDGSGLFIDGFKGDFLNLTTNMTTSLAFAAPFAAAATMDQTSYSAYRYIRK
ncbi:MAG: FG-GAP-like repeat-containing protein [Proteobacteria bacterium]|nr:FG-GAP-like repeat-containing protein [Pseudomonadota bacterium]